MRSAYNGRTRVPIEFPLMLQTTYAELLDRARAAAFSEDFPDNGAFTVKVVRWRRYWYFQASSAYPALLTYPYRRLLRPGPFAW